MKSLDYSWFVKTVVFLGISIRLELFILSKFRGGIYGIGLLLYPYLSDSIELSPRLANLEIMEISASFVVSKSRSAYSVNLIVVFF